MKKIIIVVLAIVVVVAIVLWQRSGTPAAAPAGGATTTTSAVGPAGLGAQLSGKVQVNPVAGKLPETNPYKAGVNPLGGSYKNPFGAQ